MSSVYYGQMRLPCWCSFTHPPSGNTGLGACQSYNIFELVVNEFKYVLALIPNVRVQCNAKMNRLIVKNYEDEATTTVTD